jgi:hypothetical protein
MLETAGDEHMPDQLPDERKAMKVSGAAIVGTCLFSARSSVSPEKARGRPKRGFRLKS